MLREVDLSQLQSKECSESAIHGRKKLSLKDIPSPLYLHKSGAVISRLLQSDQTIMASMVPDMLMALVI